MKSLFVIFLLGFAFTVCGQDNTSDTTQTNAPVTVQKEQKKKEFSHSPASTSETSQFALDSFVGCISTNLYNLKEKIKKINTPKVKQILSYTEQFEKSILPAVTRFHKNVKNATSLRNENAENKLIASNLEKLIQQQQQSETKIQNLQTMLWILLIPIVLGFVCKIWEHSSSSKQDDFSSENQKLNEHLASLSRTIEKMQESLQKIPEKLEAKDPQEAQPKPDVVPIVKRKIEGEEHKDYISIITDLFRLKNNLGKIDDSQPGKHQAENAVRRLETTLETKGYTFESPLNQPYNDGMAFSASFIHDETLPAGTAVITRVSSPQINFSGKMIQCASGTVSKN